MSKKKISLILILTIVIGVAVVLSLNFYQDKSISESTPAKDSEITNSSSESYNPIIEPDLSILEDESDDSIIEITGSDTEIRTKSPVTFMNPPDDTEIPSFYSLITVPYLNLQLYGFTGNDQSVQLRAYGSCYHLLNNVRVGEETGFWPVAVLRDENGLPHAQLSGTREIANDTEDAFEIIRASSALLDKALPRYFVVSENLYTCFDNNLHQSYRTWGENGNLYPCDSNGNIRKGALPVDFSQEMTNLYDELPAEGKVEISNFPYPCQLQNGLTAAVEQRN